MIKTLSLSKKSRPGYARGMSCHGDLARLKEIRLPVKDNPDFRAINLTKTVILRLAMI